MWSSQISTVTSSRCGAPISKSWNPMSAITSSESRKIRALRGRSDSGTSPWRLGRVSLTCSSRLVHALRLQELDVAHGWREALAAVDQDDLARHGWGRDEVA